MESPRKKIEKERMITDYQLEKETFKIKLDSKFGINNFKHSLKFVDKTPTEEKTYRDGAAV